MKSKERLGNTFKINPCQFSHTLNTAIVFFFSCVNSGCTYNLLCNHDCGVHEIPENNFPRNEKIFKQTSRKQYSVYNSCIIGHEIFGSFSYSVTNASDTAGSNILQIKFLYLDKEIIKKEVVEKWDAGRQYFVTNIFKQFLFRSAVSLKK